MIFPQVTLQLRYMSKESNIIISKLFTPLCLVKNIKPQTIKENQGVYQCVNNQ